MATLFVYLCTKHNQPALLFLAIPAGFGIDFLVMYLLLRNV